MSHFCCGHNSKACLSEPNILLLFGKNDINFLPSKILKCTTWPISCLCFFQLPDVCYSWWVLASLKIIGRIHWIDKAKLRSFILACQDEETGGFADRPGDMVSSLLRDLVGWCNTLVNVAALVQRTLAPMSYSTDSILKCCPRVFYSENIAMLWSRTLTSHTRWRCTCFVLPKHWVAAVCVYTKCMLI